MEAVFKSRDDDVYGIDIGVGVLGPNGKGGLPVQLAAERGLAELCVKGGDGIVKLNDDPKNGPVGAVIPLQGDDLKNAAQAFADSRGIVVVNLKNEDVAALPQEAGQVPDRPPIREVARGEHVWVYGDVEGDEQITSPGTATVAAVPPVTPEPPVVVTPDAPAPDAPADNSTNDSSSSSSSSKKQKGDS